MKFDASFEIDVLSRALRDHAFLKKAAPILDAHHFSNAQHSYVWKTINGIWDKYREQPTGKLLLARVKSDFTSEDDIKVHLELIQKIAKHRPKASGAALDELTKFVRTVNAQLLLEEAAKELEKGHIEKVWEALGRASKKDVQPKDYVSCSWIEGFEQRQLDRKYTAEHPEAVTRIPTGFKQLDHILGGGAEIGEFGLIMATTGKGKSITLINLAYNAVARSYPTVYFTLEMPARQILQRMDSRWTQYEYQKFKLWDFKPSELRLMDRKLAKNKKRYESMLEVVEMPLRQCDIGSIRRALDDLQEEKSFVPKCIIVDSADHMNATRRYDSFRLEQAAVYWDLSGLAGEGHVVWSSVHAGREYEKKVAKTAAVSESYDKARIASIVASLNTPVQQTRSTKITKDDDEDEEEATPTTDIVTKGQYMELFLAKYRDGKSQITIPLDAQFSRMYISEAEEK